MAQVIFYCRRLLPLSDLDSACLIQITKIHTRIQAHTHKLTRTHSVAHTYTYNDSSATSFALFELFSFSVCLPSHESRSLCVQCVCLVCVCVCLFAVCVPVCVRISCVLMNLYRQPALLFVNAVNWAKAKRFVLASPYVAYSPSSWPALAAADPSPMAPNDDPYASPGHRRNTPDRRLQLVRAGSALTFPLSPSFFVDTL